MIEEPVYNGKTLYAEERWYVTDERLTRRFLDLLSVTGSNPCGAPIRVFDLFNVVKLGLAAAVRRLRSLVRVRRRSV